MRIKALEHKREDGATVTVCVDILDYHSYLAFRIEDIEVKGYRKRNSVSMRSGVSDSYDYRSLVHEDREKYMLAKFLEQITPEQAKQALYNAYELIKPDTSLIDEVAVSMG